MRQNMYLPLVSWLPWVRRAALSQLAAKLCSRRFIAFLIACILLCPAVAQYNHNQKSSAEYGAEFGITGVSGRLFSGTRIRQYLSGPPRASKKLGFIENVKYNCTNWAVCTTIFEVSDAVQDACQRLPTFCLVVVADKKTPDGYYVEGGCSFIHLSVRKQEILQKHSNFALEVPWNHFGRKNIGYMFAIANGAQSVWDFDDDNKLLTSEPFSLLSKNRKMNLLTVETNKVSLNPYPLFGSETFSWPRGFPLEDINDPSTRPPSSQLIHTTLKDENIGVLQALANGDPDVDAIYRLQRKLPFSFVGSKASDIFLVPKGVFVPWNAQATYFSVRESLWALYLPMSVHGRVSDIWRSYISQRLFQNICLRTAFAMKSLVVQVRNPHSYLADFDAEQHLYYKSGKLVELLASWTPRAVNLTEQVLELYITLYERDYVNIRDVQMVQLWLGELELNGYEFPEICTGKSP